MARDLEGSFEGKEKLHRRALGTFGRIREKLACLSFIDQRIQPVVDTIEGWIERLPKTSPIEGAIFNEGMGLALLLADPELMARHGAGQMAVRNGAAPVEDESEEAKPTRFKFETEESQSTPQELIEPSKPVTAPEYDPDVPFPEDFEFETEKVQPTRPVPESEIESFFFWLFSDICG